MRPMDHIAYIRNKQFHCYKQDWEKVTSKKRDFLI